MNIRIRDTFLSALLCTFAFTQLTACSGAESSDLHQSAAAEHASKTLSYSDVDVFDGVFLGQGPVAALLPEIWGELSPQALLSTPATSAVMAKRLRKLSQQMRENGMAAHADDLLTQAADIEATGKTFPVVPQAEIDAQVEKLHKRIAEADPSFFAEFAQDMRSGNRPLVLRGLQHAHAALEKARVVASGSGSGDTWCNKCGEDGGGGGGGDIIFYMTGGGYFVFITGGGGGGSLIYVIIAAGIGPSTPNEVVAKAGLMTDELVDLLADRLPLLGPATRP